jgi:hypothetical protein
MIGTLQGLLRQPLYAARRSNPGKDLRGRVFIRRDGDAPAAQDGNQAAKAVLFNRRTGLH